MNGNGIFRFGDGKTYQGNWEGGMQVYIYILINNYKKKIHFLIKHGKGTMIFPSN